MPQLQNQNTLLDRLAILNKYRILTEHLNKPFRQNSLKFRIAGHLVLKDPCPAAGHLDAAHFCSFTPKRLLSIPFFRAMSLAHSSHQKCK